MPDNEEREEDISVFLFIAVLASAAIYTFWQVMHKFWYHFPEFLHFILR